MGVTARHFRSAVVVTIASLALVVPATAGAQLVTSVSVSVGHLQAQGTEVPIQVDFQCDPSVQFAFVQAGLTQVSGHKLALGAGDFFPAENLACDSGPFSTPFTIFATGAFAFKEGDATASVDVVVFDPTTNEFLDHNVTQTVRLTKN